MKKFFHCQAQLPIFGRQCWCADVFQVFLRHTTSPLFREWYWLHNDEILLPCQHRLRAERLPVCVGGLFSFCIFPASAMIFHVDPIPEFSVRASMAAFYSFQVSLCLRHSTAALFVLSCRWLFTVLPSRRAREANLSLSMAWRAIKAIGLSFNPSKPNGSARSRLFQHVFSFSPSVIILHQVRLSLRKELLGLVLGTSLNHRPTLRVVHASLSRFLPLSLVSSSFGKAPRSLMCSVGSKYKFSVSKSRTRYRPVVYETEKRFFFFFLSLSRCMLSALCFSSPRRDPSFCVCDRSAGKAPVPLSFTDALARSNWGHSELMYVQLSYLPVPSVALLTQYMVL